ncbi:hypothetical protein RclHR1_03320005 [Rhizophagus clarus]|uniref:Ion transport domain-containing protein n=1 Tax=Rhizophagus clarus TaxID=94130 RepID=A0A2Z6RNR3_9GLOM|nr:hypothetical protein RclHR1_03320005 [Rhizophagus clarus]GET00429.1 hypothetical protein GLOIN_2v1768207 [Rhizophagus clarus]
MSDAAKKIENVDKIEINNDTDNSQIIDININKSNDNKLITRIGISPSGKYYVAHNEHGNGSIVCWNIENVDEDELKSEFELSTLGYLYQICISDYKELVYINESRRVVICDMLNNRQDIKLDCDYPHFNYGYSTFNLEGEFILYEINNNIIFIYSTQNKNNKWKCKKMYKIPESFELIGISKYNKLYLFSNNSIYEYNFITEKSIRIYGSDEEIKYILDDEDIRKNIRMFSNNEFICIRIKNKIVIYSIELEIPITSLDISDVTQLYNLISYACLTHLLIPLLNDSKEFLDLLKGKGQLLLEYKNECFPDNFLTTTKYVFGFLDGRIWKVELEEILEKMNLTSENLDEINEEWYFDNDLNINDEVIETYDYLNINLLNSQMDTVRELYQESIDKSPLHIKQDLEYKSFKWSIYIWEGKFILQVFEKSLAYKKEEDWNDHAKLIGSKLLDESNIVILATTGLYIYHFNKNDKSISLNYYYYMESDKIKSYKKIFSKSTLPLPNRNSFRLSDEWVSYIKNNKESLLKYGAKLLAFGIKEHRLELIEEIYEKCITNFEKDSRNNIMFLSIITSRMPLLNEYYPEYISRYSSETTMIIDSSTYTTRHMKINLHLDPFFRCPQVINLSRSIWWLKYNNLIKKLRKYNWKIHTTLIIIQFLIFSPIFPIYFFIFFILSKHHFINDIEKSDLLSIYFLIVDRISSKPSEISKHTTPMINFMDPYIKFVNYPQEYNWFVELFKPKSSPFVKAINRDIYKTWNGEILIDFKWNKYGKYYYLVIWIGFILLLGCFTAAATISKQYIDDNIRNKLLIASIIFGFIHLSFEVRQFIYDPIKWSGDFWNYFDLTAFLLPICTSIYWIQTNDRNIQLLSFTCLFLDIKFLLFFRVFESFGVYFAIIISVGKKVFSFLVVLFIIIISFAHTFYILLSPESSFSFDEYTNNNDPNNPWNIAPAYHQVLENGTVVDPNPYMIQPPNENTNMFVNFGTSIFAMYKFLTGDSSALSNWTYKDDPSLAILIVLFSFLIVVYLMNLFIGLLNNAIEEDNNRVSYLIQKAQILAEIELLYLLPNQRRWKEWFPEIIYYYADADKARQKINEFINKGEWNTDKFSELRQELLNELKIPNNSQNPVDMTTLKQILEEIRII